MASLSPAIALLHTKAPSSNSNAPLPPQLDSDDESKIFNVYADEVDDPRDTQRSELISLLPEQVYSPDSKSIRLAFAPRRTGSATQPAAHTLDQHANGSALSVELCVDASPGCGGIVWQAGQILSNYLVHKGRDSLRGKSVLELGSGTGLVGIVAAKLDGKVCITDQAPLLDIMRRNVDLNELSHSCQVAEFNWGEPIPEGIPTPDIILAADCVYFEPAFPLLVQTLCDLSPKGSKVEILFCYKKRRKADKRFFGMLKKKFRWEEVMDDPCREIYSRDAVTLLQLYRI
ncbi:hypothetical protein CYLTODRAFT_343115 [Cylindrobasidium torrendii FP15055 ss-10]|uniref:Protein-lysine N-methyltransferase EFM6 n=1 Tax=Cylindrobasidium torrendii FP15055 ss-10 TaxID=1314674 RepID=A0A0D7BTM7_9AGAR|nr:hypothetical protein CYLTODRAFT_343115 [Cylindrobasidium torrendii FP15055 ss-10]